MKLVHQSTIPDNQITTQIRSGPDHKIRPSDPTSTANPDHQFRSPHQTTGQHSWLLSFQSAQHTQPLEMVQVRCILYGLGQGGYIELWMNLAKHTFHTRSAWSFRILFRLNLIVVRLASGFPGLVRASPSLFHKMGSFAGVRSAVSSAFRNRFGFLDSASVLGNGSAPSFCAFSRWTLPPQPLSSSSSSSLPAPA